MSLVYVKSGFVCTSVVVILFVSYLILLFIAILQLCLTNATPFGLCMLQPSYYRGNCTGEREFGISHLVGAQLEYDRRQSQFKGHANRI